jgi:hypothetical protein
VSTVSKPAPPPRADPIVVFNLRCESRAKLWRAGEIDLHTAVDELQQAAEASGLVAAIGQDELQTLMAAAFGAVREPTEPAPAAAIVRNRAAESTVEALMFSLRERGTAALAESETQRRLAALSSAQVRDIIARLIMSQPRYPAIDDELLHLLGEQLS